MSDVVQQVKNAPLPVQLSESAKGHFLKFLDKENHYKGLRISVKKSGCSGLAYVLDYVIDFKEDDIIEPITEKYNLFIDKASYPYLKGISIDYVTQGLNSKLKFNNPNQTGLCGCGESFTVEENADL